MPGSSRLVLKAAYLQVRLLLTLRRASAALRAVDERSRLHGEPAPFVPAGSWIRAPLCLAAPELSRILICRRDRHGSFAPSHKLLHPSGNACANARTDFFTPRFKLNTAAVYAIAPMILLPR